MRPPGIRGTRSTQRATRKGGHREPVGRQKATIGQMVGNHLLRFQLSILDTDENFNIKVQEILESTLCLTIRLNKYLLQGIASSRNQSPLTDRELQNLLSDSSRTDPIG